MYPKSEMEQLINLLKEKTGIDDATADKIANFIQEHAADLPAMLMGNGDNKNNPMEGLMDAAKGFLGNKE
jgi:hypothetical protein